MNAPGFSKTPSLAQLQTQIKEDRLKTTLPEDINHYDGWKVGDFIHSMGLDFFEGNVIKYVSRHRKKNGLQDLIKARTYINKLIELNYRD